jgi:hypothetical protein
MRHGQGKLRHPAIVEGIEDRRDKVACCCPLNRICNVVCMCLCICMCACAGVYRHGFHVCACLCVHPQRVEGERREEEGGEGTGEGGVKEDDGMGEGGSEESVKEDINIEKVRRACTSRGKMFFFYHSRKKTLITLLSTSL